MPSCHCEQGEGAVYGGCALLQGLHSKCIDLLLICSPCHVRLTVLARATRCPSSIDWLPSMSLTKNPFITSCGSTPIVSNSGFCQQCMVVVTSFVALFFACGACNTYCSLPSLPLLFLHLSLPTSIGFAGSTWGAIRRVFPAAEGVQ